MNDLALVIGLDAYDNPAWELRAAVRDALKFAEWVTAPGAGRATEAKLTLLLSPHPDRPVKGVKFERATDLAIRHALFDHKKKGAEAQRLWFFYAGHGIAPAGGGPDEAPVVVPADVKDLDFYRSNPIDLGSWIREMQVCPPEYHMYFVDACRGIVVSEDVVTSTKTLFFDLSKVTPGAQARQAVLFATTAGQLANEQGLHGLFGGALIEGLHGTGPALQADADTEEFVLTFGGLAAYAKRRIQLRSDEARRGNKTLPTQEPAESLFRVQSSLELARFKEKPRSAVRVFVQPDEATGVGTAGIRGYNEWKEVWERQAEKPSPLAMPIEWKLSSAIYKIEIEARGFENWGKKVEVIGPMELHADLVSKPKPPGYRGGLESLEPLVGEVALPKPPDGAELAAGRQGQLVVHARDRYARIEVFDPEGKRVEAAWERLDKILPVGSYRVEIALPTESPIVQLVLVSADEPEVIDVQPDPQLTERLPRSAGMIGPHDGVSLPSERFGNFNDHAPGLGAGVVRVGGPVRPKRGWPEASRARRPAGTAGPRTLLRACSCRRCAWACAEPAERTDRDAAPVHGSARREDRTGAGARGICGAMAGGGAISYEPHRPDRRAQSEAHSAAVHRRLRVDDRDSARIDAAHGDPPLPPSAGSAAAVRRHDPPRRVELAGA
jgi:hypothetical protein